METREIDPRVCTWMLDKVIGKRGKLSYKSIHGNSCHHGLARRLWKTGNNDFDPLVKAAQQDEMPQNNPSVKQYKM